MFWVGYSQTSMLGSCGGSNSRPKGYFNTYFCYPLANLMILSLRLINRGDVTTPELPGVAKAKQHTCWVGM